MKIKDRSRKRSHKLDGIVVRRIRTFPFPSDAAYDSVAYDPVKTIDCRSRKQKRKNQPITMPGQPGSYEEALRIVLKKQKEGFAHFSQVYGMVDEFEI